MNRVVQVIQLQRPAWAQIAGWAWGMMAVAFGINLLIFAAIQDEIDGAMITGGLTSLYAVAVGMAVVSVTQVFPYALGMSVTRREFYGTWSLLAVAQSVVYALVLSLLYAAEQATDHWGVGMRFFGPPFMDDANPVVPVLVYAASMLVAIHLGILCGTVYLRWGTLGVFAGIGLVIVGVGLTAAVITWTRQWTALGRWLLDQSPTALATGWPLLVAAALALGGYSLIRRATA
jgi:hypothetical protein